MTWFRELDWADLQSLRYGVLRSLHAWAETLHSQDPRRGMTDWGFVSKLEWDGNSRDQSNWNWIAKEKSYLHCLQPVLFNLLIQSASKKINKERLYVKIIYTSEWKEDEMIFEIHCIPTVAFAMAIVACFDIICTSGSIFMIRFTRAIHYSLSLKIPMGMVTSRDSVSSSWSATSASASASGSVVSSGRRLFQEWSSIWTAKGT